MLSKEEIKKYSAALQPTIKKCSETKQPWDTQSIYGDVLDSIRDNYPELRNRDYDDDFVAHYAIGEYVINHNIKRL